MLKLLLFLGAFAFVIWFFFLRKKPIKHSKHQKEESMVECSCCKTFVLQNEAILSNGKYFCSKECLLKG